MNHTDQRRRRELVQVLAGTPFAALLHPYAFASPAVGRADLIVTGDNFHTMDPAFTNVEAMAIRGRHIVAVGSRSEVDVLAGPGTKRVDARGMTVTPGFIDAHSHPLLVSEAISVNVNVRSIAEVKELLRAQAAKSPAGHWVLGHMYDDTKFVEGRALNRDDIDEVVREHPVYVLHRGGHTAVVNSRAFEIAGVDASTPDPVGGRFFRENGRLTGKVAEPSAFNILKAAGTWPRSTRETNQQSATLISRRMATSGLTSTTDAFGNADGWRGYIDALDAGELDIRIAFMPGYRSGIYQTMVDAGIRSGFGNAMLRVGAMKCAADGSASERTMRMSTPFEGTNDYGILTMTQEEIDAAVDEAVANGFRIGIHANGDVAIHMVLNAYERVLADWEGENPRFRIEHCSLVFAKLLERIKATGAIPTPFYTYAYYHGNKWVDYGLQRMRNMFAHRSFLDYGIMVAPASDYTPGPYEPMMAIQSMVTRKDMQGRVWGENQRISAEEAMRICTMHGAYASFEEHDKGSLTPGKLADFVLLGSDPLTTDPEAIKDIPVIATYMDGRVTHEA